jgi:hypothetical protein
MASLWLFCVSLSKVYVAQSVKGAMLTASLHYGNFKGAYNAEYNISYRQKVPFAAPPVGQNLPCATAATSRPWSLQVHTDIP